MATNVVVIDSSARRATVKTTPGTYLSDVLAEACSKLGADNSQYVLKHNNKTIDLSRTIRLSGLTSGAKLELVQLSKSAGVVNVALQLPESEVLDGISRITDKFPSSTTLWSLLRKFEAGVAGSSKKRNFTARGTPSSGSGAGRLFYERPVLNIMGRELSTFTDLQRNLTQLGLNTGSVLVKLSFCTTDLPLEEAMAQIQEYFNEVAEQPSHAEPSTAVAAVPDLVEGNASQVKPEWLEDQEIQSTINPAQDDQGTATPAHPEQADKNVLPAVSDRTLFVYKPPTTTNPASTQNFNESDYVPTVEHAQVHQKHLQESSRNKRLPTDAEVLAKQKEQREELEKIESVEIKVRLPDQSAVHSHFGQADTAAGLYDFVRQCLEERFRSEPFLLRNLGVRDKSGGVVLDNQKRLIVDLNFKGRILLTFTWDEKASVAVKATKDVLKPGLKELARDFVAPQIDTATGAEEGGLKVSLGPKQESSESSGSKSKVPKWLKGLGKR